MKFDPAKRETKSGPWEILSNGYGNRQGDDIYGDAVYDSPSV